ncbi:MAG TPA: hypothetical protein VE463_07105 [Blastococcus sp.]|nr:hypothetical protein [Blastococcus sp.]
MAERPWTCRLGIHSYVREHPRDERPPGPGGGGEVCRRCGRRRGEPGIPLSVLGG